MSLLKFNQVKKLLTASDKQASKEYLTALERKCNEFIHQSIFVSKTKRLTAEDLERSQK